jgi:hypothetical protein
MPIPETVVQDPHVAEMMAYAMKPQMDVIASERAVAPVVETTVLTTGGDIVPVTKPDLSPQMERAHATRKQIAVRNAGHAAVLVSVVRDRSLSVPERQAAKAELAKS